MENAPLSLRLRALGSEVHLVTDSRDLVAGLQERLGRFVVGDGQGRLVEARFQPPPPQICAGGPPMELFPDRAVEQAVGVVFRALLDGVEEFLVLHAAALERDGLAYLVAGPSGSGKTTLTLALLERGYRLLSDDFAPLERGSGLVHPFFKAAGIRAGAAQELASAWGDGTERFLAPDSLPPSSLAKAACPIAGIAWISDERLDATAGVPYPFSVICAGSPAPLLERLTELEGVRLLETRGAEIILQIEPGRVATRELDEILEKWAPHILEYGLVASLNHDPNRAPRIESLAPSAAMLLLAREIQNRRPGSRLLASLDNRSTRLAEELGAAIGGAPAWRLIPGASRATAQRLDETFRAESQSPRKID